MFKGKKIFLVDDDAQFRFDISGFLATEGYYVAATGSIANFAEKLEKEKPDLALIDKQIGFEDGFDLIHVIRKHSTFSTLPVIVITGSPSLLNRNEAIQIGADDFIEKPVNTDQLRLRLIANLRRSQSYNQGDNCISFGNIEVNLTNHSVTFRGEVLTLTQTEYKILTELISKKDQIVTRDTLAARFLSFNNSSNRTIDVHINSLRKKLLDQASCLKTIRGRGYMLVSEKN